MYLFNKDGTVDQSEAARLEELLQQKLLPEDPVIIMARFCDEPLHHELEPMTTVEAAKVQILDFIKTLPKKARGLDYRLLALHQVSNPDEYLDQIRTAPKLNADTIEQVDEEDRKRKEEDKKRESNPLIPVVERLKECSKNVPVNLNITFNGETLVEVRMHKGQAREVKKRRIASN
jgi:hypothetical protein